MILFFFGLEALHMHCDIILPIVFNIEICTSFLKIGLFVFSAESPGYTESVFYMSANITTCQVGKRCDDQITETALLAMQHPLARTALDSCFHCKP